MNRILGAARLHLVLGVAPHPLAGRGQQRRDQLPIWKTTDAGQQPGGSITGGLAPLYAAVLLARLDTGPFAVVTTWRAGWDDLGPG
jgi:hypothetical protein